MNKDKIYETPSIMEVRLIYEQTVLSASGGPYDSFGEEEDWGN